MINDFDENSDMWVNDPQVVRDQIKDWDARIERAGFDMNKRQGVPPNKAYHNPETRSRYVEFLKSTGAA